MRANPRLFMDIFVGTKHCGKLVFELRASVVPRTVENFIALALHKREYGYKNNPFHRIVPGLLCQAGDITNQDGSGGISVWGYDFRDENFILPHSKRGCLAMANFGPDTNNSQFYISFRELPHLDGQNVVLGELVEGFPILDVIESVGRPSGELAGKVIITDCGLVE